MTVTTTSKHDIEKHELSVIEQVVIQGDLSKLDPAQRVTYYHKVCQSMGLNPLTRPLDYVSLNGKLTLYAKKDCTEQLRKINGISIEKVESKVVEDLYIVKASARTKDGRTDESTGAVAFGHLKGEAKANAIMKAETKAKRRVTLSISGMGWVDETEIENIPNAKTVDVDMATGEIRGSENTVVTLQLPSPAPAPLSSSTEAKKPSRAVITESQLKCLIHFIDNDEVYYQSVIDRLKERNINGLAEIPQSIFESVLADAKANYTKREEEHYGKKESYE